MTNEYVREGDYLAIVDMEMIDSGRELAPHIPLLIPSIKAEANLKTVRHALQSGDITAAAKLARVYELKPVATE